MKQLTLWRLKLSINVWLMYLLHVFDYLLKQILCLDNIDNLDNVDEAMFPAIH